MADDERRLDGAGEPGASGAGDRPSSLAAAILDLEEERRVALQTKVDEDERLVGTGEHLTLKESLAKGGRFTFVVLSLIVLLENLEAATLGTLAPEIRDTLGVSDGTIVVISAASGAFLILGAAPMGYLADRLRRGRIIGVANLLFGAMSVLSGMAANILMLFLARLGVGVGKSSQYTVHGALLADQYPISTRGRIGSTIAVIGSASMTMSPLVVGGLAALLGGDGAWRWVFVILSVPTFIVAFIAFRLPEPPRGQYEQQDLLGRIIEEEDPLPISSEAAFARLLQIRTLKTVIMAFAALGFALFTVPVLTNLWLEDHYDLGTFGRGLVSTLSGVFVLFVIPIAGRYYDKAYTDDPSKAIKIIGALVLPGAVLVPIQFAMPNVVLFAIVGVPIAVCMAGAFSMIGPIVQSIVPYRLRGMGSALSSLYIFLIGATGGAVLAGLLANAYNPRVAVLVLYIPSTLVGGFFIFRGASFIRADLRLVGAEIREEQDEYERRMQDPEHVPALQVNHVDFSYGQVQILFDVSFDVHDGEVLALLGTNGAGKSTILRVIAGLGTPARGVVRHRGRSITYVSPEMRTRLGIRMLPGGKGVFNDMTVEENLEMALWNRRSDRDEMERGIERSLELFPELSARRGELASALSGGQQQLLALARLLTEEPDVLIIDELSLGLAPIMVERLVGLIGDLKMRGMTIVVVEQSLNVAAAIADRAVFLEKGHVRFEGDMRELNERDDLARAVFLGSEGG